MKRYKTIKAWEIRKYDWHRCKLETNYWDIIEGKISINNDWKVFVVHNNPEAGWDTANDMMGYEFGWCIYDNRDSEDDNYSDNIDYKWIEIDVEEELEELTKEELIKIIKKII